MVGGGEEGCKFHFGYIANAPLIRSLDCERDRDRTASTSDLSRFNWRSRETYGRSNESRPIGEVEEVGEEAEIEERGEVAQDDGNKLVKAANDRLVNGDLDGVDGGGVGGCCSARRLPEERLMLTRVREPLELVPVDLGVGTKTGDVTRGRRLPLSPFDGAAVAVVGLVGLRGGGLSASRSHDGSDEPMLPDGMAMSSKDGWGCV